MPVRTFEVCVSGLVSPEYLVAQGRDIRLAEQELRTVLVGSFQDQAELQGLLDRLHALGLEVVEVRRLPTLPTQHG